jgi:hypothetical protein
MVGLPLMARLLSVAVLAVAYVGSTAYTPLGETVQLRGGVIMP